MDNLKEPAYPLINQEGANLEDREVRYGFTKLELAALMIAQGMISADTTAVLTCATVARESVSYARALLEEANK